MTNSSKNNNSNLHHRHHDYNLVATDFDENLVFDTSSSDLPLIDEAANANEAPTTINSSNSSKNCKQKESNGGDVELLLQHLNDDDDQDNAHAPNYNGDYSCSGFYEIVTRPYFLDKLLNSTLLPDDTITLPNGTQVFDAPEVIKLLKFMSMTALLIVFVYYSVRIAGLEHKWKLTLNGLYTYESALIMQDALVFFLVGRLYQQRGVDHLQWVGWCLGANLLASNMTRIQFLRHSFTLYEIHCRWPWQLFVFCLLVGMVVAGILGLHFRKAVQNKVLTVKLVEIGLCLTIFLVPYLPSKYAHAHHWYLGWLVGMHFNYDVWWSRAAKAWCWGLYVNGVAVYGRDPVLMCGYSFWLSDMMRCPYLNCYKDGLEHSSWLNDTNHVTPMSVPDWRNCSTYAYHP